MQKGLRGWRITTVRGVDLKIHFSLIFLLIYAVLLASLDFGQVVALSGVRPRDITGYEFVWARALWGFIFALGLFTSVVLHEFGHVLVAQKLGVKVHGVTLMMLGGVSEMERVPEEKYAEFKIAVAGPLVSFALASLLYVTWQYSASTNVAFLGFWFFMVNAMLGVFNLFPAFPLDGGRAFRSLLAARGNMLSATRRVVGVAKVFAWVFGILGFINRDFILILIAFFIHSAAKSELVLMTAKRALKGLHAGDVGTRLEPLRGDQTLSHAASEMYRARQSAFPVESQEGKPMVVQLDQLSRVPRDQWPVVRLRQVLQEADTLVDVNEPLEDLLPQMMAGEAYPLMENGEPVGVIHQKNISDILRFRSVNGEDDDQQAA